MWLSMRLNLLKALMLAGVQDIGDVDVMCCLTDQVINSLLDSESMVGLQ